MPLIARRDLVWLAVSVAVLLGYWFVGVVGRVEPQINVAGGDLVFQFLPYYVHLAGRMQAGEPALWDPLHGQPFLAMLLPGTFYPARLLLLAFAPPTAMHVATIVHLVLAFAGTFLLCRALGTGRLGSCAGGVVFVGVHALPALYWPPFLEGGAWFPVAALALVRVAATGSWGWTIVLGAATGLMVLAGCYQHFLYALYGLAAIGLALLADRDRRGWLARPGGLVRLAAAAVLAAATAAPQALPTLAWSALTVRSGAPLTDVQLDVFPWPGIVLRRLFDPWGTDSLLFVSIPVAGLAAFGCLVNRRFGAVLLVASATSVALCLGRGTPAFVLFHILPGFASFRLPDRVIFLVAFLFAVGVALGVDRLARGDRTGRALAVVATAVVVTSLLGPRRIASALPWTLPADRLAGPPALMSLIEQYSRGGRTLLGGGGWDDGIAVKQPGMHGVRSLQDYNPLSSRRLAAYLYAIAGKAPPAPDDPQLFQGFPPVDEPIVRPELLDMAAVRTVLAKRDAPMPRRQPPFHPIGAERQWVLYENPQAFPRAYSIERARFVPDDAAALDVVRAATFDARNEVVLTAAEPSAEAEGLRSGPAGTLRAARVVHDAPEHVVVEVRTDGPAVLVLTDPIAPGWRATVDGQPAPLLAANALGRGVVVPAGEHRVAYTYGAPGLHAGLAAFAVGWGLAGVLAAARCARRARA